MSASNEHLIKLLLSIGQHDEIEPELRSFSALLLELDWCQGIRFWTRNPLSDGSTWLTINDFDAFKEGLSSEGFLPALPPERAAVENEVLDYSGNCVFIFSKYALSAGIATTLSGQGLIETVMPIQPALLKFIDYVGRRLQKKRAHEKRIAEAGPLGALTIDRNLQQKVMATLSHELRNPLNLILGYNTLLQETSLSQVQKEYAAIIKDSAFGLYQTVKKVFQFLHVMTGRMVDEEMDFRITDVVSLLENQLKPQAEAKGLMWSVRISQDASTWLRGDMPKLHDVLFYLIDNAIKFSGGGIIELTVNAAASADGKRAFTFTLRDQGKGVDERNQQRIFEFFSQEDDGITRNYGGLGLGLSLADLFVKRLGGKIQLKSATGLGTSLSFEVCFAECTNHKPIDIAAFVPDKSITEKIGVLVVDDDLYQRKMAAHILRNWKVSFAGSGKEAIEYIRKNPDTAIILMDIRMPEMDGITATRIIRTELHSKAPIIAVSGEALEATIEECFDAGMNAFVSKPFDGDQLLRTVILNCETLREIKPEVIRLRPSDKLTGLRGLVVEDNKMIQLLTMRYLRDLECKAELAPDVETALEMTDRNSFDFILLDLHLPDGTGYEVARKVRETNKTTCLIAYSGEDSDETTALSKEAGINGMILKTYHSAQELAIKINRFIDEMRPQHAKAQQTNVDAERRYDYDLTKVKEIIGDNLTDLVLLLEVFVEHSGKTLEQLLKANRDNDMSELSRYAHSLKSSAKQFGMDRAAELLFALEQRTGNLSQEQLSEMCAELEDIFKRAMPALSGEIEKLKN